MKKEVKKSQEEKQPVERSNEQSLPVYCPECCVAVALSDPKKVEVVSGMAHLDCAFTKASRLLVAAGLPRPVGYNDLASLRRYLKEQAAQLSGLPLADPVATEKLAAVHEAAAYLRLQFNLPAVMKKVQPAAVAALR